MNQQKTKTITQVEFYNTVKVLVDDAFAFLKEDPLNFNKMHAPAHLSRWIQIRPRRAIGKTYAATRLAADFDPMLFVFPNTQLMRRTVDCYREHGYYPTNPNYACLTSHVLARGFLSSLGQTPGLGQQTRPSHFRLGIIDDATMIEWESPRTMDELRAIMSECCDIILELG